MEALQLHSNVKFPTQSAANESAANKQIASYTLMWTPSWELQNDCSRHNGSYIRIKDIKVREPTHTYTHVPSLTQFWSVTIVPHFQTVFSASRSHVAVVLLIFNPQSPPIQLTRVIFLVRLPGAFPWPKPAPTGRIMICDEDVCKFAEDILIFFSSICCH